MILLVVLAGLYAIGATGYYKLSHGVMMSSKDTEELAKGFPVAYRLLLSGMTLIWPVMMYWALVKEAAKTNGS